VRFRGICYRAHDPKWAFSPVSGEGAKAKGGRFNPIGVPALYLSLRLEGMFLEMSHGFAHRLAPLTICTYDVDVEDILDLRTNNGRNAASVKLVDMACPWALDLAEGRVPASWVLAKDMISGGAAGILVPSFARGARTDANNLVLWTWGADRPHRVVVHDPQGQLPKDQRSWS
jgi:RES domain-containing protein